MQFAALDVDELDGEAAANASCLQYIIIFHNDFARLLLLPFIS